MITHYFYICHQQYADDTQLLFALNPSDPSPDITKLTSYLGALQSCTTFRNTTKHLLFLYQIFSLIIVEYFVRKFYAF